MTDEGGTVREQAWYAILLTIVALGLVAWTTLSYPLGGAIAFDWPGLDPAAAILVGVGYWMLFGLLGALRARRLEAGTVLTFHMPFVVAGTILGGPVVGGWMGLLSQFERRELGDVPWYGLLGNHAIIAIAAVAAGAAGEAIGLAAQGLEVGDGPAQFARSLSVAIVFVGINFLLVLPVVAIKRGGTLRDAAGAHDAAFRATVVAEGILAWLMATVYVMVGGWAPLACVALVLVVWQAHDRRTEALHDPMTGLLNEDGFRPHLRTALAEARAGRRMHMLILIDMNDFGIINKRHGPEAGDETIRGIAGRLRSSVRDTDVVARSHRAGDEFLALLHGVPDAETAEQLAWRLCRRLAGPLQLRSTDVTVDVSGSLGYVLLGRDAPSLEEAMRIGDRRMQIAKQRRSGVLGSDAVLADDETAA
jgi:diguanylate cyclase (GGDEF)-like protein